MSNRIKLASECHDLRAQLKEWEKSFADTNSGRKPNKEDIKKNPDIAAKYKTYNRTRDVLDGKKDLNSLHTQPPSVRKQKNSSSLKRSEQDHAQTPRKTLFATPRKARHTLSESHPSVLDPYDAPPASVSPHPYVFKNAIGPTPQRDGKMLGLFDLLSTSGSTPSTRKRKASTFEKKENGMNVAQTPSRKPTKGAGGLLDHLGESSGGRRHTRTPASDGKKFLLSQFFATPSTMRFASITEEIPNDIDENRGLDQTPLRSRVLGGQASDSAQTDNALGTTPAYLKRNTSFNQRLRTASASTHQPAGSNTKITFVSPTAIRTGPKIRAFKGRALSEILRGLRQMEDNDDEDGMDALREMEGNDMNVLVGDSQTLANTAAVGEEPARVWKKKGQKRSTRRVIMRPTTALRQPRDVELGDLHEVAVEDEVARVDDTQAPLSADQELAESDDSADDIERLSELKDGDNKENRSHTASEANLHGDNDFTGSEYGSDADFEADELASTPPSKKRKVKVDKATRTIPSTLPKSDKTSRNPASDQAQTTTTTTAKEQKLKQKPEHKQRGTINPNAHSHLNFRSLKIRNKNSKGKGRAGRGRR